MGYRIYPLMKPNGKRFYGKAHQYSTGNADVLVSYRTAVCEVRGGEIYRLWDGWSASTLRHVRIFLSQFPPAIAEKADWRAQGYPTQMAWWWALPTR